MSPREREPQTREPPERERGREEALTDRGLDHSLTLTCLVSEVYPQTVALDREPQPHLSCECGLLTDCGAWTKASSFFA